jgi:hypothetical protein
VRQSELQQYRPGARRELLGAELLCRSRLQRTGFEGRRVGRCIPLPNVELTGRQRCDALAARQMMNQNCIAASVARRWRSG